MISGFEEWASSAQLVERGSLELLRGSVMGFEADEFIGRILTSIPTREPLLPALGGLPFGLDGHIEERLTALSEFDIKPVFVFNGLNPYGQERKLDAQLRAISSIKTAWDYYSASHPDLAVAEFGNNCSFDTEPIYRYVQRFLLRKQIDFMIAPYSACAQLVAMLGSEVIDSVAASDETLMLEIEQTPKIQAVADLMKQTNQNGNGICLQHQDDPGMVNYLDQYQKAFMSIRHHIVMYVDGTVAPLNKENKPNDEHDFMGQRLADELYFYLSCGVVGSRVLTWRAAGEAVEGPSLDGGYAPSYQELINDKLVPLRSSALALLSQSMHNYYQHRNVSLRCWFNTPEIKSLNILGTDDLKRSIAGWNVSSDAIKSRASALKLDDSSLTFALQSLKDNEFAQGTVTPSDKPKGHLQAEEEIRSNAIWRYLQLRGYVQPNHELGPIGDCLLAAYTKVNELNWEAGPEFEQPVMLALEMIRLGLLNADNMFPSYSGAPLKGSDIDKRNCLLVSRVACLGRLEHKSIGYTGPLSRNLLAFQCMASAVRRSLRDLVEMSLCTMLLNGQVSRTLPKADLSEIGLSLPFLKDNDCALGVAVKSYLEEIASHADPTSQNAHNVVLNKGQSEWFPHSINFPANLNRAFQLWDAVYAAVTVAPTSLVATKDKKLWEEVDRWLVDRR
ncbi:hypothetical protein H2203_003069 [Taxawa tesnikishii (nom. ined.)]|nr:hypothetical protein H2203_003069 [Dothideales sp. JES 119]